MGVTPTIQTVKNLEVEVRKNEGEELYEGSWENAAVQDEEQIVEECPYAYCSDDEEPN